MDTPHHRKATSGCFAAVLRRILCRDGLPTHPSDHIAESKPAHVDLHQKQGTKTESQRTQAPAKPGVVARLMGLESLPDTSISRIPDGPDSVSRSRSVNFMDYLAKFDFADPSQQQKHRRVRSSVSFREVPETAPPKPSEVFVLYLEKVGEKEKVVRPRQRKSEVATQNLKQEQSRQVRHKVAVKKEKVSKLKDEPRRASVQRSSKNGRCNGGKDLDFVMLNKKEIYRKRRPPIKAKASTKLVSRKESVTKLESAGKKTEHDQCSSVDSSPVSVLDLHLGDFSTHRDQTQFPEESSTKLADNKYQFPIPIRIPDVEDAIRKDEAGFSSQETEYLMEVRSKLCRLAEEDMEESKWSSKDETEDMCVEFGSQILNQLLEQVVDELVLMPF